MERVSGFGLCGLGVPVLLGALGIPAAAELAASQSEPVKAAVIRSQGTQFLGMTIWRELNSGWADFGDTPVEIDYTSLAGYDLSLGQIQATDADVLIISTAGFLTYQESEIDAIIDYVEAGHGIIITYFSFYQEKRRLAPLVGLSETIELGTSTWPDPFGFDLLIPEHSLFAGLASPYPTGVPVLALPATGTTWRIGSGTVVADARPAFQQFTGHGVIVANDTPDYRGVYFAHYPEAKSAGSNVDDMQVFYNGLLWTAVVPEPGALALVLPITCLAILGRGRR